VASESTVTSDAALGFAGVDVRLEVLALAAGAGDFARMVLGCDPVVDVKSVPSISSLMLERDAARGPAWDVMRVPLSTLRLAPSISFAILSALVRRILFALAALRKSAAVVAVSGGLGGARGGGGAALSGGCVVRVSWSFSGPIDVSTSVACGVMADFLLSESSLE
jgi:hypothetical protein